MLGAWRKPLARKQAGRGHITSVARFEASSYLYHHEHLPGE